MGQSGRDVSSQRINMREGAEADLGTCLRQSKQFVSKMVRRNGRSRNSVENMFELNIYLSHSPTILVLGVSQENEKQVHSQANTQMFIAALFTITTN